MQKKDYNNLEEQQEKEKIRRDKRKKPKMKVSGAGVKRLQRIIGERGK